ncbi:MAG: hypothetical protein NVS1B4_17050 [Gemmatimonadaceae bacterium]
MVALLLATILIGGPLGSGVPTKAPRAVGMSSTRLAAIDRLVRRGIKAGGYPGAAVVVGRKGATVWQKGFGHLDWSPQSGDVDARRTLYDLASLTKVVGTTTAIMLLYDQGKLGLDDPVVKYVAGFTGGFRDSVTIRQLLTHTSGLPSGRDLWRLARSPAEARQLVIDTQLECRPGSCYVYSDLGADMLALVAEAVSGQSLDVLLRERVFAPLGMQDTFFKPDGPDRDRTAPTEVAPPRGYPLRGEVHDENAFTLGGVAGHAGLFSTASDLATFAQMMLNGGKINGVRIVSDSVVRLFTKRSAGHRALGWDTCTNDGSCGNYLGEEAYGHTGFTGTSLWIDPDREMFVILLTNRVHAARARRPARVIADVRADLSDAAALAVTDGPDGVIRMPSSFRADRAVGWNRPAHARGRRGRHASRRGRHAVRASPRHPAPRRHASPKRKGKPAHKAVAVTRKGKKTTVSAR